MSDIKFEQAEIVTAFSSETVGTKVIDKDRFLAILAEAVKNHDPSNDRAEGQHFVMLPPEACQCVSAGVGQRTQNPEDYVARLYRGNVELFLKRELAAEIKGCACVVYTKEACLRDPDILADQAEVDRINKSKATHVIVAPLAFAGPDPQLSPYRFVHNLAGGNREAETYSADEIRAKAKDIKQYADEWCTVAD